MFCSWQVCGSEGKDILIDIIEKYKSSNRTIFPKRKSGQHSRTEMWVGSHGQGCTASKPRKIGVDPITYYVYILTSGGPLNE